MQANFKVKLSEKRNTLFSVFLPSSHGLSLIGKIYALGLKYCPRASASGCTQDHGYSFFLHATSSSPTPLP